MSVSRKPYAFPEDDDKISSKRWLKYWHSYKQKNHTSNCTCMSYRFLSRSKINCRIKSIMDFSIVHIFVFVTCVNFSAALFCYDCRYDEGSSSMKSCENDPGLEYSKEVPFWQNPMSKHKTANAAFSGGRMGMFDAGQTVKAWPVSIPDQNQQSVFWYCMKITGKYGGKKVVIRGSAFALEHGGNEVCEDRLPPNLGHLGLTDVKTCYCDTKDNCNSSSALNLSLALIFVGLIICWMKK